MSDHAVPKRVGPETLREILAGWAAVGAATDPRYTADVADHVGVSDAVGRQSAFFEELGLLEPVGQKHRLTEDGAAVAGPLVVDEEEEAATACRDVLESWPVTERIQGIVASNPLSKAELVSLVAAVTGQDEESGRVRTGIGTLLELLAWADLLERDEEGRYRLPSEESEASGGSDTDTDTVTRPLSEVALGPERGSDHAESSVGPPVATEENRRHDSPESSPPLDTATPTTSEGAESRDPAVSNEHAAPDAGTAATLDELVGGLDLTDVALESAVQSEESHTLTLSVDADPADVEALVRAIRRGLSETE